VTVRAASDPPVQFRSLLPPIQLDHFTLCDRCRITEEQAAPLNAALLARMPALGSFDQNLLPPAPAPDSVALAQFTAQAAAMNEVVWDKMEDDEEGEGGAEAVAGPPLFGPQWEH
jgi:hypothetical protein